MFEVRKSDVEKSDLPPSLPRGSVASTVDVVVPPELEGAAYIVVSIHKISGLIEYAFTVISCQLCVQSFRFAAADSCELNTSNSNARTYERGREPINDSNWSAKLEYAHNVIFCKELFAQVCLCVFHADKCLERLRL